MARKKDSRNPRRRGPAKPMDEKQARYLDRLVLEIVRDGQIVYDPATGAPLHGNDGEVLRRQPSAAMIGRIQSWIAYRQGRGKQPTGDSLDTLNREAGRRLAAGLTKLPPVLQSPGLRLAEDHEAAGG